MSKIKGIIKNEENMKNGVWLSAPWYTYYHELEALFGQDPEISMDFNEDKGDYTVTMHVRNEEKEYALMQLLPTVKSFGSIAVRIRVIPSNVEYESDYDLLLKALKDNPVFAKGIKEEMTDYNYILFKKEVVEFFNDELGDPYGFRFTLFQDIANDVFANAHNVFFSTYREGQLVGSESEKK